MNEFDDGHWIPSLSEFFQALDVYFLLLALAVFVLVLVAVASVTVESDGGSAKAPPEVGGRRNGDQQGDR
jgi:hypothetical protein